MPFEKGNTEGNKFIKGQSGNPDGRPKDKQSIADMLKRIGEEDVSTKIHGNVKKLFGQVEMGDLTMMEAVMRMTMMYAIQGKPWAVQFIADRLEGKPKQTIDIETHEPIQLIKTGIDNFDNG